MTPHERLKMLLEGDVNLMDLDTHLNEPDGAKPAQAEDETVPVSKSNEAKQGVSGTPPSFYHDPANPMGIYKPPSIPVSYIRTHVIGEHTESEDIHLTLVNQDGDGSNGSPDLYPEGQELLPNEHSGGILPGTTFTAISTPSFFTPAVTMARFPFKYVYGESSKRVNARFYEGNQFWNRIWDLYYLQVPKTICENVFLLIPTVQAQALLDEINSVLHLHLALTGPGKKGLVLAFDKYSPVHPIFLGQSSTLGQKKILVESVPCPFENWGVEPIVSQVPKDFEEKVKQSVATTKQRKGKDPNKQAIQDARNKKWKECIARTQAHFGLRPPLQPDGEQPSFANGQIRPIDILSPVNWEFHETPIFISIDLEWNERYPSQLTEVGISTLDTMDLQGVVPGDYGEMWMSQIRSRHLRVNEYKTWVNHEYISGCPTSFGFGKSELVPNEEIPAAVDAAFYPPYMIASQGERIPRHKNQQRNLILVGLNPRNDINLLQEKQCQVFLDLDGASSIIREVIDVAELYRVEHEEIQVRGLQSLLGALNILACNLHNAGNDASYTMQALVRLMLEVAGERPGAYERGDCYKKPNVEPNDAMSDDITENLFS